MSAANPPGGLPSDGLPSDGLPSGGLPVGGTPVGGTPNGGAGSWDGVGPQRAMYQPPNPEDLRRVPPQNPSCARVRSRLRDYADGDLVATQVALVDEHVQACRACAVELARAEHEVLRLRHAFAEIRAEQQTLPGFTLRDDFAARVVEQLVLTDRLTDLEPGSAAQASATEASTDGENATAAHSSRAGFGAASARSAGHPMSAGAAKADGGTAGEVMAGSVVADESHGGSGAGALERDLAFTSPGGMIVSALLVLFCLTIGMRFLDGEEVEPQRIARLVIQNAEDCYGQNDRRLSIGDILGEQESLWVQRGGGARMHWHDPSDRAQPAASLEIHDGELQLKDGAPMLVGGRVMVSTNRDVEIPMADGSRVALGMGEYLIAAIPADMVDDLGHAPDESQWGRMPGTLRIEVEVRSGDPAKILRAGGQNGTVKAGSTASYQGGGVIGFSTSNPVATVATDVGDANREPVDSRFSLTGHVMGPDGQPSAGTVVSMRYVAAEQEHSDYRITGANGVFTMPAELGFDSPFGVVFSIPNIQRPDLGIVAPHAVPVVLHDQVARLERPVAMGFSAAVNGLVLDDLGGTCQGVLVIPLIVDELFGSVYALTLKQQYTSATGRFLIEQLPSSLPAHQRLGLLLSHPKLEATFVPVPVRGSVVALPTLTTFVASRLRRVDLFQLPVSTTVTFFEEVVGLPAGSAAVRRTFNSDANQLALDVSVGRGRMWMLSNPSGSPMLSEMQSMQFGPSHYLYPASNAVPYRERLRPLQSLNGSNIKLVNSSRHEKVQAVAVAGVAQGRVLRVRDSFHRNIPRAEVFAITQSECMGQPNTRFLGFTGDNGVLSIAAVGDGEDVFVIGPEGGIAWISRPTSIMFDPGQPLALELQAPGRVLVDESLRPTPANPNRLLKLVFYRSTQEVLPGMVPVAVRFATDGQWEVRDVPAGSYVVKVSGANVPVVVPSTGFVNLKSE